jgi:site-specific DNA-methyltransferase (adenine-specific)
MTISSDHGDFGMELPIDQIIQGDCIDAMRSLPPDLISCCITDPPYNYEFVGRQWNDEEISRRLTKARAAESKTLVKNIPYGSGRAGGVRNPQWYQRNRENILSYEAWCALWGKELYRICRPGATVVVFNSTRTIAHVQVALEAAGFYARDIIVYRRSSGIPKGINFKEKLRKLGDPDADRWDGWHSCLRGEWEAICVLQKPLQNNYVETVEKYGTGLFYTKAADGGFQSNILEDIPRDATEDFNVHCTVKPLPLMQRLISIFAPRGSSSIVLDPFAGSGTTLVAAKQANLRFIGIEIEPKYVEIIRKRLSVAYGSSSTSQLADARQETSPSAQEDMFADQRR